MSLTYHVDVLVREHALDLSIEISEELVGSVARQ